MITMEVDDTRLRVRLARMTEDARSALRSVILHLGPELAGKVRQKLTSGPLHVRSGALLASIHNEMVENTHEIYQRVYSTGVVYAAIHEYGGQTKAHPIYAVKAQFLRFELNGKIMFRKMVNHPGSKMPERSYLRSSLAEMREEIVAEMKTAVRQRLAA